MKLSSQKRRERKVELTMTSMIDVVFLLLIFFMVTSAFVQTERNLPSGIKVEEKAAGATTSDLEPTIIEVSAGDDGRFAYRLGGRNLTSPSELTHVLRQIENKWDGAFVKVADEAPFRMAASAIQSCKNAGFETVSYIPLK